MPFPEDPEGLPVKISVEITGGVPLPDFVIFDDKKMTMSINPTKPKNAGTYSIKVSLSDGYAAAYTEYFKIIVEDPLASERIKRSKEHQEGIQDFKNIKKFETFKGIFKIKKVTRDSKVIVKFICSQNSQKLLKGVTHDSLLVNWLKYNRDPIPLIFSIESVSL